MSFRYWVGQALVSALCGAVLSGVLVYRHLGLVREQALAAVRDEAARAVAVAQGRADRAARVYEGWKAAREPALDAAARSLNHEMDAAPDWAAGAVPERVRLAIAEGVAAATGGAHAASEPAPAVPALGAADADAQ